MGSKTTLPEVGTIMYRVRENITMGVHMIKDVPEGYGQCAYQIVKAEVKDTYEFFYPKCTGIRCVEINAGPNNVSYFKPSQIGKAIFYDYDAAVSKADEMADEVDKKWSFRKMPTYRPWRNNNDK